MHLFSDLISLQVAIPKMDSKFFSKTVEYIESSGNSTYLPTDSLLNTLVLTLATE